MEEVSGKTWEQFGQERILDPLQMTHTTLTIEDNLKNREHAVPYSERRDSTVLYKQPYYTAERAIAPAGAAHSHAPGLAHRLNARVDHGAPPGTQAIPQVDIRAQRHRSIRVP